MQSLVVGLVAAGVLVVLFAFAKRSQAARHRGAATVDCRFDHVGVTRELADGRVESAQWGELVWVEVVRTPVATADGAGAFVVLGQLDDGAPVGCLVPLDVGYDGPLLSQLHRLDGFDAAAFRAASRARPPSRTVVWGERPDDF